MTTVKCTMCDSPIEYSKYTLVNCGACAGTGRDYQTGDSCSACNGAGFHTHENEIPICTKCDVALTHSCRVSLERLGVYSDC